MHCIMPSNQNIRKSNIDDAEKNVVLCDINLKKPHAIASHSKSRPVFKRFVAPDPISLNSSAARAIRFISTIVHTRTYRIVLVKLQ